MLEFLLVLALIFMVWIAMIIAGLFVVRWRLHHANRVSPHTPSTAPLTWLVSPSRPARTHRRLRSDIRGIDAAVPRPGKSDHVPALSVDGLLRELEQQAVNLDRQVVVTSRQPRTVRRDTMNQIDAQVDDLEQIAMRLTGLHRSNEAPASGWDAPRPTPAALEHISQQVGMLEAAHEEIASIGTAPQVDVFDPVSSQKLPLPPR